MQDVRGDLNINIVFTLRLGQDSQGMYERVYVCVSIVCHGMRVCVCHIMSIYGVHVCLCDEVFVVFVCVHVCVYLGNRATKLLVYVYMRVRVYVFETLNTCIHTCIHAYMHT